MNIFSYAFALKPPKCSHTQLPKQGHSSFMKKPLYFTLGSLDTVKKSSPMAMFFFSTGLTSPIYSKAVTPMYSESESIPYIVPLLSLPAITSALSTPSNGASTRNVVYTSHFPAIHSGLNFPSLSSLESISLLPYTAHIISSFPV